MEDPLLLIHTVETLSYWSIFGISLIANMLVPIPEEFFLLALGYVSGAGSSLNIFITAPLVVAGLFISDIVLFSLARSGNRYIKILERKIKNFRFTKNRDFVEKHIEKIIFISRFVLQFRFIGPVLAGTTKTSYKKFMFYDFLALMVYVPLVLFIGNYFHDRITSIIRGVAVVKNYVFAGIGILIILWLARLARRTLFKDIIFSLKENEKYQDTWVPGIKKKKQ